MKKHLNLITTALVISLCAIMIFPRLSTELMPDANDSAEYYLRALSICQGTGYTALEDADPDPFLTFTTPPLLPYLLAMFMLIFGTGIAVAKVGYFILALMAILGIFFFFRSFFDRTAAVIATAAMVLSPEVISFYPYIMTDLLNLGGSGLLLGLLARKCRLDNVPRSMWFLLGIGFGALIWMRYGNVGWIAAGGVWMLWRAVYGRESRLWREMWWFYAGAALGTLSLIVWIAVQDVSFFSSYLNWHINERPGQADVMVSTGLLSTVFSRVFKFILYIPQLLIVKYPLVKESLLVILVFGSLGSKRLWKSGWGRIILVFLFISALPYAASSMKNTRYCLPTLMLLIVPTVYGLQMAGELLSRYRQNISRNIFCHYGLAILIIWFVFLAFPQTLLCYQQGHDAPYQQFWIEARTVAGDIRGKLEPDAVILSVATDYRLVSAYSGYNSLRERAHPPLNSSLAELREYLRQFGNVYAIVNDSLTALDPTIDIDDILEPEIFLWSLRDRKLILSDYIFNRLSEKTVRMISEYREGDANQEQILKSVVEVLNVSLNDPSLYIEKSFSGFPYKRYMNVLSEKPEGICLAYLNRLLIIYGTDNHVVRIRIHNRNPLIELWLDRENAERVYRVGNTSVYRVNALQPEGL